MLWSNMATHLSLMCRAGVNGMGFPSNCLGPQVALSPGAKTPLTRQSGPQVRACPGSSARDSTFSGCFLRFQKEKRGAEREGVVFMPLASFA
jgi:hypothetical protein